MIDTVDFAGVSVYEESDPRFFEPLPHRSREQLTQTAGIQLDWIEQQLKESTATYTIVGGHYPVYSICSHGPTSTLITNLKPLLEQYQAHYISGHDRKS